MRGLTWLSVAVLAAGLMMRSGSTGGDLARLVTPGQAKVLGQFYQDLATVIDSSTVVETTGQFRMSQQLASHVLQSAAGSELVGISQINQPINAILVEALGDDSGQVPDERLTMQAREKLVTALQKISGEF